MITLLLALINYMLVLFFGIFLTLTFAGIKDHKKNKISFFLFYIIVLIIQIVFYFIVGLNTLEKAYPFFVHLPLVLYIVFVCKKSWLVAVTALVSAYLFTTPRRFIGTIVALIFNNDLNTLYLAQIIITFPYLWIIQRFISPSVKNVLHAPGKVPLQFSSFLIFYYFFSYATTVYTNLLYTANAAVMEFTISSLILCYFIFNVIYYREMEKRIEYEKMNEIIEMNAKEALKHIDSLKESQEQAIIYRHDLRHHLQYIATCIQKNDKNEALNYIQDICDQVDKSKIMLYCENLTANMVLSAYLTKASSLNIDCIVDTKIPKELSIPPSDLCIIIANSMENAIKACKKCDPKTDRYIKVFAYVKNKKLFFEISNTYGGEISFENEMPVCHDLGHGIGTKSIVKTVEKYGGLCSFKTQGNIFILRIVL